MLHEPGLVQNPMLRVPITVPLDWRDRVNAELDSALDALARAGIDSFADTLATRLDHVRAEATPADWVDGILPWVRAHPAIGIARARLPLPQPTVADEAGNRARRTRHLTIANVIDAAAARSPAPHILALGSGRLPELDWSVAVTRGRIGRLVAADRDRRVLRHLATIQTARLPALLPMALTLRDVLRGGASQLGPFDAIYAADLVTPPPPATLATLVGKLFARLKPGGQLILGALAEVGGTSALHDALAPALPIWRSAAGVAALAAELPRTAILSRNIATTPAGQSWYLDLRRV
ncbi:MAG: hypothetical protein CFE37_10695 [Alphaproteobacteria bacterium PA4]|nr:MAG: hypothetical protein CFE37_10695 [Alphaproteobacteria bacterium PA4]